MLLIRSHLLLCALMALCESQTWAAPLTLVDCLNEAMQKNPQILQSQQDIEVAGAGIVVAKAALYPSVTGYGTVYMSDNDLFRQQAGSVTGFNSNWDVVLTMSKTLYNGGVTRNQIANSELQKEIALSQLQQSVNTAIYNTRRAFYDVLLNQSDINLRNQTIELLKREVERQKSLFEAGRATKFNILRTEVRLANELPGLEQAKVAYSTAIYDLMNEMGRPASAVGAPLDIELAGTLDIAPYAHEIEPLVTESLSRSPEIFQTEKRIEMERHNVAIAKASNIPQISAYVGTLEQRDSSHGSGFGDNYNESTVGLAGTWNIFDGFSGKGSAAQASARLQQDMIQRDAAARKIEYDVRNAILSLQQAEAAYQTQKVNVAKALQSIDLARSSVEAGFGTQFDILQATVDLSAAQNIELRARYQYNVAVAELDRVLYRRVRGTPGDVTDLGAPVQVTPAATAGQAPPVVAPGNQP